MADRKKMGSKGSATLELTIIFPVIMLVFFSLVFLSMHLYQKLIALDAATYTASQASATWDNTHKEFEGGFLPAWNNDGLYWRLLNDRPGSGLAAEKTGYAGSFLSHRLAPGTIRPAAPEDPEVEVAYDNSVIRRTVSAGVRGSLFSPVSPLIKPMAGDGYEVLAESDVAEPAEFIRICDLGGEYLKKIADYLGLFGEGGQSGPGIVLTGSTYAGSGGKDEKIYHYPGCRYIGRIKEKREFNSVSEAKAAGYHLCIKCAESRRRQLESHTAGLAPGGSE